MSREYTIVGGGAIGGTIAFHLARAGHAVRAVDTDAAHVAAIRADGLRIRRPDGREERQPLAVAGPDEVDGPLGAVLLAVKAQATGAAVDWLAPRLAPDGFVVSLQNGLCEPEIGARVGESRTVAAFVNIFADLVEPGVIADGGPGALVIGEPDGRASRRVAQVVADLQSWGPAVGSGNVAGYLWSKLSYSAVAAASATVDAPVADTIEQHPDLTVALAREVYAIAQALGVRPEPFDAWRAAAFLPTATGEQTRAALADFVAWLRTQPKAKTGIWRDLAVRRRPTEVPAILTPAQRLAAANGLATPGIDAVLRVIGELETGRREMAPANLTELEQAVRP